MTTRTFVARLSLPVTADEAYAWHARPGAFERLSPPWERVEIVERTGRGIEAGTRLVIRLRKGLLSVRWVAVHGDAIPGERFEDVQESGPFAAWRHRHLFRALGPGRCELEDRIDWAPPFGPLGGVGAGLAERRIRRLFAYRHAVTLGDLERHGAWAAAPRLKVAITGASGLVGRQLAAFLTTGGHEVRRMGRHGPDVSWDPEAGRLDSRDLEGLDAVVHLAGESVGGGRWTEGRKRAILRSRVLGTELLARTLASMSNGPRVLVSASAIGIYGDRPGDPVDESAAAGEGFLADVVRQWEAATAPAEAAGIRVARLRFGVVLSGRGGALAKMLPAFRLGAGGPIGSGRQGLGWVALDDVIGAIHFVLMRRDATGVFNVTAPEPVSQAEFAKALGRVLRRPAVAPLPAAFVRAMFGAMGQEMLLEGQRVIPRRLIESGFRFRFRDVEAALRFELGCDTTGSATAS